MRKLRDLASLALVATGVAVVLVGLRVGTAIVRMAPVG